MSQTPGRHGLGTTYWCKLVEFDQTEKQHIVEIEPIVTEGNEKNVHHILLYTCSGQLPVSEYEGFCMSPTMPSELFECYQNTIIVAWGIGAGPFTFPQNVGYPVGGDVGTRFALMEIHYDNPDPTRSFTDHSGLRLWTTKTYRQHEAGLLAVGYGVSRKMIIPPQQETYLMEGFCHGDCTSEALGHNITIFAGLLHMHTAGMSGAIHHYRNGIQQPHMHAIGSYDFDLQLMEPISPAVVVSPGDDIVVQCVMGTKNRLFDTIGGLSTEEEMCLGFMYYYPRSQLASCSSEQKPGTEWDSVCDYTKDGVQGRTTSTVAFPARTECLQDTQRTRFCSINETETVTRSAAFCPSVDATPWDYTSQDISRSEMMRHAANVLTQACSSDNRGQVPSTCTSEQCNQARIYYLSLIEHSRHRSELTEALQPLSLDCISEYGETVKLSANAGATVAVSGVSWLLWIVTAAATV